MNSAKKKKLPKSVKGLSPDQLAEILKKKKICNSRALKIVETLIEPHVDEEWALKNFGFINQSHFVDVIEERLIGKLCGYPFCSEQLGDIPKQQFKISLAAKAVYDVTERKKFCSANCYKSSQYLMSQLLTSPLWFRENDVLPTFKLLKNVTTSKEEFISNDSGKKVEFRSVQQPVLPKNQIQAKQEESLTLTTRKESENVIIPGNLGPVERVQNIIDEWFTIKSFAYLFGIEELKKVFEEDILKNCLKESPWDYSDSKRIDDISKLFAAQNLDGDDEETETRELQPVPNYAELKDAAEKMNIKIKAFYSGQLDTPIEVDSEKIEKSSFPEELPFIDNKSQTALRRKVLLDQLNKKVPAMCIDLDLDLEAAQIGDIRCLVRTFSLSAHNVTMMPREWSLISAIILRMLSVKVKSLASSLNQEEPKKRIGILLASYNLGNDYLDVVINKLADAEQLRKQNMY